jgi:ABC-type lipoprotein release transport system permease subunit
LILLAACANLGSLFAARAADRSREVALRLALGSSRNRVLRGFFTEAVMVSILGGSAGVWASVALLRWLSVWQPFGNFPVQTPVTPDARVYAIALLLTLVSGCLCGFVPVGQVLRKAAFCPRCVAGPANIHMCGAGHLVPGGRARLGALPA